MPSVNEATAIARRVYQEAFDDGRRLGLEEGAKNGEHSALMLAIHVVDLFIEKSDTYDEFKFKWQVARGLYQECVE